MSKDEETLEPGIVFLDVDGVLNHKEVYARCFLTRGQTTPADWLDPECIERLNRLVETTHCKIVLSSGWRHFLPDQMTVEQVLQSRGLRHPLFDSTPKMFDPNDPGTDDRWQEIQAWMKTRSYSGPWVALDDCDWGFPKSNWVQTSIKIGLTDKDVESSIQILSGEGSNS